MEVQDRVVRLEDEVKVLKNEVQAVLLDIRESYLNRENPFNPEVSSPTLHSVAAAITGQSINGGPQRPYRDDNSNLNEDETENKAEEPATTKAKLEEPAKDKPVANENTAAAASDVTAIEEVNEALRSEEEPEGTEMQNNHKASSNGNGKMNLVKIAGLAKWVDNAVSILGRNRTETVLDFAELTGHLPVELKTALVKLVNRVPDNANGASPAAHQLVTSLIELEGLLGMNSKSDEMTLLAMVCQEVHQ